MSDLSPATAPFDWRSHLPIHPAADLFPLLSEQELKVLAEDIRKNGLRTRIVIYSTPRIHDDGSMRAGDHIDYLVDGRNRLDALAALGFLCPRGVKGLSPIPFSLNKTWNGEEWEDSKSEFDCDDVDHDPYEVALSLNIHRRHLTSEQKRDLIAELLKAKPEQSNRSIAKQVKADDKTVASVRRDMEATAEIPQLKKTVGADGKARKQPSKKVPNELIVNGQPMDIGRLGPAAQEQIAAAIAPAPDPDIALVSRPHLEVTPAVRYLDKPWLATATEMEAAIEAKCDTKNAPLVDLEKQLQSIVTTLDVAERAAANLIYHMVDQRKQSVRSIAKVIGKDAKWVKEKLDAARLVTEAAA